MNRTSSIWLHFKTTDNKDVGECNYCKTKISVKNCSTTNLRRHIKAKHPTVPLEAAPLRKTSCTVSGSIIQTYFSSESAEGCSSAREDLNEAMASTSKTAENIPATSQSSMKSFVEVIRPLPLTKTKILHDQLLRMIVKEYYPFSIVEDKEFIQFLNLLNPSYKPPTRKTLTQAMLPSTFNKVKENMHSQMLDVKAVALTTDGWTCIEGNSFVAVTVHYIEPTTTELKSALLSCSKFGEAHSSENLRDFLLNVCKEWHIENKVTAVVSDNAANIRRAVLDSKFRNIGCFAHILNLVAQKGIKCIEPLHSKAKALVQHFKQSSKALAKLEETQRQMDKTPMKLKQDVPTMWNSTFEMFERLILNQEPLTSCCALLQLPQNLIVNAEEWTLMAQCVEVLAPFYHATLEVCAEKSLSLSKAFLLINIIKRRMAVFQTSRSLGEQVQEMVNVMFDDFAEKMRNKENEKVIGRTKEEWETSEIITQAAFLDPRYKHKSFSRKAQLEDVRSKVVSHMVTYQMQTHPQEKPIEVEPVMHEEESVCKKRRNDLWDEFDVESRALRATKAPRAAAIVEYDKYLAEPLQPREGDPLKWWNERRGVYPLLYPLVLKRLCIPATSVPCERVFSKAGLIKNEKRSRLLSHNLSQIIFLNQNL